MTFQDEKELEWAEGYVTALDEVRALVDELLARADSCIRGGKANSYLRELKRRWPIPSEPEILGEKKCARY